MISLRIPFSAITFLILLSAGCKNEQHPSTESPHASTPQSQPASSSVAQDKPMQISNTYHVAKAAIPLTPDANWDKPAWQKIEPIELTHFMGTRPSHFPKTLTKLAYDDRFLYVIFKVDDRYVRAVAPNHQGSVCN